MIRTTMAVSPGILFIICTTLLTGCASLSDSNEQAVSASAQSEAPTASGDADAAPAPSRATVRARDDREQTDREAAAPAAQAEPVPEPRQAAAVRHEDLWQRVRDGFALPEMENKYVAYYERWYRERPEFVTRMMQRASRYLFFIVEEVDKRGMPLEIALLPAVESAFKPMAYSRAHASGLWQFIPATGRRYGLKQNWWYDGRRDVISATRAALDYLQFLHTEFDGNWFHALAAYNAGERRVQRAILQNSKRRRPTDYEHLRLKSETRRYVPKLIAIRNIVASPENYGLRLQAIPNRPHFGVVATGSQIDLGVAGKLAGLHNEELRMLNPAFRRWATDPDGPHRLLVPLAQQQVLEDGLAALPDNARLRWARYTIKRGDNLGSIARRHGISVDAIQASNGLRGTRIRAGDHLIIPLSAQAARAPRYTASSRRHRQPRQEPLVHHVRSGDTLWAIARRYDVYVKQLRQWNAMRTNEVLRLGQKILVYQN